MPIPASLRAELAIGDATPASGGCIHECYRVVIGGEPRFLKLNDESYADALAAEADGLHALREARLRAPAVLGHGVAAGRAYLLLEFLHLRRQGDFAALGRMLARAHRAAVGERFGWHRDNYLGLTLQQNGWDTNWADFWRDRRLGPQLALAARNGFALPDDVSPRLLENHEPQPSLLHGDLWSGNAGFSLEAGDNQPVVFDPAVYYGDREADLAMTELFGGFPETFYQGYESVWPLEAGYERRKHLYNLYHLLNHLNLFGAGYLDEVQAKLRLLRSLPLR